DAPDAYPTQQKITHGREQEHHERERHEKADPPAKGRLAGQGDGTDLVRDGSERVAGTDNRCCLGGRGGSRFWRHDLGISGLGLRKAARYVVWGWVFSSASKP